MFEVFGYLMYAWILVWIAIIAIVPNAFMGGLTMGIAATVWTYFDKKSK